MLSPPYHPIQKTLPRNARIRDFGDGHRGIEIDGNSAANPTGFTQRVCLTQGESRSIRSSVLVKSTLVAANNGYEGIGFDVKCLIRNGDSLDPLVTWTNAPFRGNDPTNLFTEQLGDWTLKSAVVYIPNDAQVEFIDCTWGVRGSSGQVKFSSASLRNMYLQRFKTVVGSSNWTSFDRQIILVGSTPNIADRISITGEIKYLDSHSANIEKNSEIEVRIDGSIINAVFRDNSDKVMDMNVFAGLKMRRSDGNYDYWGSLLGRVFSEQTIINNQIIDISSTFHALNSYTQIEPIIYTVLNNRRTDYSSRKISISGLNFNIVVRDVIQGAGRES